MMRAYNHNLTPGFTPSMASFLSWGPPGLVIPVTLRPDPANPSRCQSVFAIDEDRTGGGTLTVWAAGAAPLSVDMNVPPLSPDGIEGASLELKAGIPPFPQGVVNRGPLPPFPPGDYASNLWFQPPALADKRYWRCNFGCVTIPDLPWVNGMEGANFDRVLTGFFGRYPSDWQQTIARTYYRRGYTHFLRWVQDELIGSGLSIAAYVDQCKLLKDAGIPYIAHSFLSKTYASNPDVNYLRSQFGALIDALQAANMLDICIVGFELTLVSPGNLFDLVDYFTVERGLTEANGCPAYVHHIPGYTWPGPVGGVPDRRSWWNAQQGKLTGLLYQCDPAWDYRLMQDRIRDTTDNSVEGFPGTDSGFGHPFDLVPLEPELERAFGDNATLDENDLDQCGYVLCCTPGQLPTYGFGCGGRRPEGPYL